MHFSFEVAVAFSLSILIAGIIGVIRFDQIDKRFKPFLYLIWIGCINEIVSICLAYTGHYTIINGIIYDLCESILLMWFFKTLRVFANRKNWFYYFISFFILIWVIETFFKNRFGSSFTYYFNVIYYFIVVLFSIRVINNLLFTERELLKNSTFLICIGLILFFSYGIISRVFWLFGLKSSITFLRQVQTLYVLVNLFSNLIFAVAFLFMRKRQAFTFRFDQ